MVIILPKDIKQSLNSCLVITCWERDDLLALVSDVYCRFVPFPCGILGQVYRFLRSAVFLTYTKRIEVCFSLCIIFAEFASL